MNIDLIDRLSKLLDRVLTTDAILLFTPSQILFTCILKLTQDQEFYKMYFSISSNYYNYCLFIIIIYILMYIYIYLYLYFYFYIYIFI